MKENKEKMIDYVTIAGLIIFAILGLIYLNLDTISHMNLSVSLDSAASNISVPGLPSLNFNWFTQMDPVSKLVFSFLMMILAGCLIGSVWILVVRKRASARR